MNNFNSSKKYNNLIDYGSYGYIFYPPDDFNYTILNLDSNIQYIIKLILNNDGDDEINNQILINNIDKNNEYHLGCYYKINTIPKSINNHDFKLFNSYDISELCLIVQKYGGVDLYKAFKNKLINNLEEYKLFLIEIYRILEGIKKFNENNLIHHDINPKNIVYNKSINRLNYIDFGLTTNKQTIIINSNDSNYEFGIFHSSFPIESGFYNKNIYEEIINYDEKNINSYCYEIKKEIIYNIYKKESKIVSALKDLFSFYYVLDNSKKSKDIKYDSLDKLNKFLINLKNNSYEDFINKSLNTFDLYGYGLCLLYSLRYCEIYLNNDLKEELYELALKMADLNVFTRLTIETAQNQFNDLLVKHNILQIVN